MLLFAMCGVCAEQLLQLHEYFCQSGIKRYSAPEAQREKQEEKSRPGLKFLRTLGPGCHHITPTPATLLTNQLARILSISALCWYREKQRWDDVLSAVCWYLLLEYSTDNRILYGRWIVAGPAGQYLLSRRLLHNIASLHITFHCNPDFALVFISTPHLSKYLQQDIF